MTNNPSKAHARRRIRLLAPVLLATTIGLVVLMVATVWASYAPITSIELSSDKSSVNADVTSNLDIPKTDVNFDAVVTYTPPDWGVAGGPDDVPLGTLVGTLSTNPTLGLTFSTCTLTAFNVNFDMKQASIDISDTFAFTGAIADGTWSGFENVGGLDRAIVQYPDFLAQMYPVEPHARYFGKVLVGPPFNLWVIVQFIVFEPGTSIGSGIPTDPSWGYGSVTALNNPIGEAEPSALGEFCTRLVTANTTFGEADGYAVRTNPKYGGTYTFRSWSRGQPDADGDGFENSVDPCPFQPDTQNPKEGRGPDNDALGVCDPDPEVKCWPPVDPAKWEDCDEDGFAQPADNCPQVPNGKSEDNQADADKDGIGDACDLVGAGGIGAGPNTIDGTRPEVTNEHDVEIDGPAKPVPTAEDRDGDGVKDADEEALGSDPDDADSTPEHATVKGTCTDKVDNDKDGDIDAEDEGCAVTATATATPEGTGTPTPTGTATPTTVAGEGCAPVIPGTYNGLVRLNGAPAAAGYEVTAVIDGTEWGSTIVSGGRYALDVPQKLPAAEPCFAGGTLTFQINGATCEPTEEWASGLHDVDLSCAAAATATPPVPTAPPGTPVPGTPVPTPAKPPVTGGGGLGGDQGLSLWAMVVIGWGGLTALAGLGTLTTRIVKR